MDQGYSPLGPKPTPKDLKRKDNSGPRIDENLIRETSSDTSGDQRPVEDHSLTIPITQELETTSVGMDDIQNPSQHQPVLGKKIKGLRNNVKWPKSCRKEDWVMINTT